MRDLKLWLVPSAFSPSLYGRMVRKAPYGIRHVMLYLVGIEGLNSATTRILMITVEHEGTLDALIRPLRVQSSDAETHSIQTTNESTLSEELDSVRISSPNDHC